MAKYKLEKTNVKKKFYKLEYVDLPSDDMFWFDSKKQSKKDKIKVRYIALPGKYRNTKKVVHAIVEFPDNDCWYYTLLE